MAGPIYPDVPNAPGVPPVQRDDSNSGGTIQPRLTSDSQAISNRTAGQWGIYTTSGGQVLEWDNVISVEGAEEFRNSDYPVEKGGFATYNKVTVPFETRVIMTKGGPLSEEAASADATNTGTVQAARPTPAQDAIVASAIQ
jgi:hypothetical protein